MTKYINQLQWGIVLVLGVGKLGGQNSPHFYMRIVPKYKEDYGTMGYSSYVPATSEQIELTKIALQPTADNIIAEKRTR